MINKLSNQKGVGLITVIIFVAFIFALLNVYSYYNPSFELSKYSPLNYLRAQRDERRVNDLKKLEKIVQTYYDDNNKMPAHDGWCGRISGVIHPEFASDIKPYLESEIPPFDPQFGNTNKDYFYIRVDRNRFALMAVLELPKEDTKGKFNGLEKFQFSSKCHDWPGDDVYNYQVGNLEEF